MKTFAEMNGMEKKGAEQILREEGWNICSMYSAKDKDQSGKRSWSKGNITVEEKHLHISEIE